MVKYPDLKTELQFQVMAKVCARPGYEARDIQKIIEFKTDTRTIEKTLKSLVKLGYVEHHNGWRPAHRMSRSDQLHHQQEA